MQSTTLITLVPRSIGEIIFILGTSSIKIAANCAFFSPCNVNDFFLTRSTERLPKFPEPLLSAAVASNLQQKRAAIKVS